MQGKPNKTKQAGNWMWFRSWSGVSAFRLDWQIIYS